MDLGPVRIEWVLGGSTMEDPGAGQAEAVAPFVGTNLHTKDTLPVSSTAQCVGAHYCQPCLFRSLPVGVTR